MPRFKDDVTIPETLAFVADVPRVKAFRKRNFGHVFDQLRTRPGQWAMVATVTQAHHYEPIRSGGLIAQLQQAGCEVKTRRDADDRVVRVYARFGEESS